MGHSQVIQRVARPRKRALSRGAELFFLGNAPGDRTHNEPLTIVLYDSEVSGKADRVAESVAGHMERTGLYPHVRVASALDD